MSKAKHNRYTQYWTGGSCNRASNSEYQTRLLLNDYVLQLTEQGCKLANDCIRTWFFVQNVDVNYAGVVKARKEVFITQDLTEKTHYISSTGIEGRHADPNVFVQMDTYAVKGLQTGQIQFLYAPTHLNPTYEYGVTFERGTAVTYGDRKQIFISGTASIDNQGEIMYPGDILKQTDNILSVYFYSPTKFIADAFAKAPTRGTEDAMNGFVHIRKAHCMFGWDWGAHLPDAGIWRPVSLLGIDTARIDSVEILQYHGHDSVELDIKPEIEFARKYIGSGSETGQLSANVRVVDPVGNEIINRILNEDITKNIHIDNPQLWWPRGYGEQNLYTVSVDLVKDDGTVVDNWTRKIGLRTITMDRTKDKWGESFATCVNDVNIFAMGRLHSGGSSSWTCDT